MCPLAELQIEPWLMAHLQTGARSLMQNSEAICGSIDGNAFKRVGWSQCDFFLDFIKVECMFLDDRDIDFLDIYIRVCIGKAFRKAFKNIECYWSLFRFIHFLALILDRK